MFRLCKRRLGARLLSQKIIIFFLASSCSVFRILTCHFLNLAPPYYTLICVANHVNLCVKYFYSPFSFLSPANTSCGLPLKMLRKTPIYTCGTYLVMLVPPPGGSGSSATRSLFGGTSGLSSLKSKLILFVTLFPVCLQL